VRLEGLDKLKKIDSPHWVDVVWGRLVECGTAVESKGFSSAASRQWGIRIVATFCRLAYSA
jgi:hypothetical protein